MMLLWLALTAAWAGGHTCVPDETCAYEFETEAGRFTYEVTRAPCGGGPCLVERIRDAAGKVRCASLRTSSGGIGRGCADWPRKLASVRELHSENERARSAVHSLLADSAVLGCWTRSRRWRANDVRFVLVVDPQGRVVSMTSNDPDDIGACVVAALGHAQVRAPGATAIVEAQVRFTRQDAPN